MRVFAGPNGFGKSTLINRFIKEKSYLINPNHHINPDYLNSIHVLNFTEFGLKVDETNFRNFILKSPFFKNCNLNIEDIKIDNNCFDIPNRDSYIGALLADYLRYCYINSDEDLFSYETVFSHPSKVDFLQIAKNNGSEVYLYFVCTENPCINLGRVEDRVNKGGHDVPQDKTIERYTRSLENVFPALRYCKRVYFFDNTKEMQLIAEINSECSLIINGNFVPCWFEEYVLSKFE